MYVQRHIPGYTNTAYGSPSDGSFASRPKTSVKITSPASGCSNAHATPSIVCR